MKILVNDQPREIAADMTLAALLQEMGLQPKFVAVEVNLEVVPRQQHDQCTLRDGDRLEIVTLVGGG
jgi:sulfur carrier protein